MSVWRRLFRTGEQSFTNVTGPPLPLAGPSFDGSMRGSLQQAAVWACVRLRAETIGALPVGVVGYEGASRIQKDSPGWLLRPNPELTTFGLFEFASAAIDLTGNALIFKQRNAGGRVVELWPMNPTGVTVDRDRRGVRVYSYGGETYRQEDVLHIRGFNPNNRTMAPSPIELHAESVGLALTAQRYGKNYFDNGSVPLGVIESPTDPGEAEADRMRAGFERVHRGARNSHRPAFLFGGATWRQVQIPNDAAQFLETRRYQTAEIARIFRVPPHKIGDLDRATFSNIEHQGIEWATDGVAPYTSRIADAVSADLDLVESGDRLVFNLAGLFRGDIRSMYAAFATGRQWGWLSVDDIRAMLDLNPLPDGAGQVYLQPLNMAAAAGDTREGDDGAQELPRNSDRQVSA